MISNHDYQFYYGIWRYLQLINEVERFVQFNRICFEETEDDLREIVAVTIHMSVLLMWMQLLKHTRIYGGYAPLILAPAEGCWVGFWRITWAFSPITLWFG